MSATDEILADIPLSQLAAQLGVDEATAEAATRQAIPALLGGLQANAEDPGRRGVTGRRPRRPLPPAGRRRGGPRRGGHADGEKIVGNIFGSNTTQVAQTLGGNLGQQGGLIQKLLPILAPIVLAYIPSGSPAAARARAVGPATCSARSSAGAAQARPAAAMSSPTCSAACSAAVSRPVPNRAAAPARSSTCWAACSAADAARAGSATARSRRRRSGSPPWRRPAAGRSRWSARRHRSPRARRRPER